MLVAIQDLAQLLKYHLKEGNFCQAESDENIEALLDKIPDPFAQNSSQLNDISGNFLQLMFHQLTQPQVDMERSTVEQLKEFVRKYFDPNDSESKGFLEVFELFLDLYPRARADISNESELLHHILESLKSLALNEKVQQEGNDKAFVDLFERVIDLFKSSVATQAQPSVCHVPLD